MASFSVKSHMKRYLTFFLVLVAAYQSALAESARSVKAASFADKTMSLYLEASYVASTTESQANLRVENAKVILVMGDMGGAKPKRIEMSCIDSDSMLVPFQNSPYGRGSEGVAIGLECSQGQFIFILYRELKDGGATGATCGKVGMLNTKPAALAASFGHQAFCMEDWSAVADPALELETQISKLQERK